jgi:hypothetical protein
MATAVYLEEGSKRVFACSLDWPGWCRSAKTGDEALDLLGSYAPRYAVIAKQAGLKFGPKEGSAFDIVERVEGSASTDFGVPGSVPAADLAPLMRGERVKLAKVVEASWKVFDKVASKAPASLRKGPRGGGRDRDKIIHHVADAEAGYGRKFGVQEKGELLRPALLKAIASVTSPEPPFEKGWPVRYAARRISWHAIDHLWEIEDRSNAG